MADVALVEYDAMQCNAIQYNTIQYNTIQYNTIQYNTIQYNTIQYNTIQYNTIQFKYKIARIHPNLHHQCPDLRKGSRDSDSSSSRDRGVHVIDSTGRKRKQRSMRTRLLGSSDDEGTLRARCHGVVRDVRADDRATPRYMYRCTCMAVEKLLLEPRVREWVVEEMKGRGGEQA